MTEHARKRRSGPPPSTEREAGRGHTDRKQPSPVRGDELCWRVLYERWAPVAWRLVTGPLTQTRDRDYFFLHLDDRIGPVAQHMAGAVVPLGEQLAFLRARESTPADDRSEKLRARGTAGLDPSTDEGRRAIRALFAAELAGRLEHALYHQHPGDRRLGLPRSVEEYPWTIQPPPTSGPPPPGGGP